MTPNFWGLPLRYMIGANRVECVNGALTMVPYGEPPLGVGPTAGYCNALDEYNSGDFPPYMKPGDTASKWKEGQIDPDGPGWEMNLRLQFHRRRRQLIRVVEIDNLDSFKKEAVRSAFEIAYNNGLYVIAKNPCICEDPDAMVTHPACVGIITEPDCGSVSEVQALLKRNALSFMPAWFVADNDHRYWAFEMGNQIVDRRILGMGVSYSSKSGDDQYNDVIPLIHPQV